MGGGTSPSSVVSGPAAGPGAWARIIVVGVFLILAITTVTVFGTRLAEAGAAMSTRVLQIHQK